MENEYRTLRFEEAEQVLADEADALPEALFEGLNGGVVLTRRLVPSPHSQAGTGGAGLFTLGEYHHEPFGLGRYITLYYGSFVRVHGRQSVAEQKAALRQLLRHELTHHVESLAGVRDLEVKDEMFLEQFTGGAKKEKKKPKRPKE